MALLGYARVSTSHQKLTLQVAELKSAGVREDRIFTDMMTGATDEREGLQRLLGRAEKDDIIICTKMDRLGRNTADMIHIVDACYKKGISIRFLETASVRKVRWGKWSFRSWPLLLKQSASAFWSEPMTDGLLQWLLASNLDESHTLKRQLHNFL